MLCSCQPFSLQIHAAVLLQDMLCLYAFAFFLQLLIHIPYFIKAATFKQTGSQVVHRLLDMLMYAAPVSIPTILMTIGRIAYVRMAKDNMDLKFPEAMQLGGMADVVCFDKTGTLTHSAVRLAWSCMLEANQQVHSMDRSMNLLVFITDSRP